MQMLMQQHVVQFMLSERGDGSAAAAAAVETLPLLSLDACTNNDDADDDVSQSVLLFWTKATCVSYADWQCESINQAITPICCLAFQI